MKNMRRFICFALAVAMLLGMNVVSFAARKNDKYIALPNDVKYEINVENGKLTLISNQKTPQSYATKDSKLALRVDKNGMVLGFETKGNNYKEVILGKDLKHPKFTGNISVLTVNDSLDYNYKIVVDGKINELTVAGGCNVELTDTAVVNKLGVHNKDAKVIAADGAKVVSKNDEFANSTVLDVEIRDYNYYTAHSEYDRNTNTLILRATNSGCTVKDAIKDAIIKVETTRNTDAVSGKWYWPNLDGGSTESGTYCYRFMPTNGIYKSAELTVKFISAADNDKLF